MIQSRLISAFSKLKIPPLHLPYPSLGPNLYLAPTPSVKMLADMKANGKKNQGSHQQLILVNSQGKQVSKSSGSKLAQTILEEQKRYKDYNNRVMNALQELIPRHHLKMMKMLHKAADSCSNTKNEDSGIHRLEKVVMLAKLVGKINESILEEASRLTAESQKEIQDIISLDQVKPSISPSHIEQAYKQTILALLQNLKEEVVKRSKGSYNQFRKRMGENSGLMNPDFEESFLQIYSTDLKNLAKYVETNGFNYFGYLTSIVDKMNENPVNHAQPHKKKDGKKRSK